MYHYKIISYEGIIDCELEVWLADKKAIPKEEIIQRLNHWSELCAGNNLTASLCKINLLQAKLAMASLDFDEAQVILMRCISNANSWGLPFHRELAQKLLTEIDNKFYTLF